MQERVLQIPGKEPLLVVAPHGADDHGTAEIATMFAKLANAYAVINQGFERSPAVDTARDLADCNRVDHVKQPVVFDEFLEPIERFANKILIRYVKGNKSRYPFVIYIHGAGDIVHKNLGSEVAAIVGYGLGVKQDSLTMDLDKVNRFMMCLQTFVRGAVCDGGAGGRYAGRSSNNMNQYFVKHGDPFSRLDCLQIEIPYSQRKDEPDFLWYASALALAVERFWSNVTFPMKRLQVFI